VFFLLWRGIRLKRRTVLIQARLDGEIAERVRIARDLHDRLGGTLTALKQNLPKESTTTIALADEAIREMRHVSHHLLPDSLNRYGLRVALRDYCQTLKNVSFSFIGKEERLDKQKEEAIYCMVYELVNNAVKRAQAKHIHVQLFVDEQVTAINVSDDGRGITDEDHEKGMGLSNLRQRVNSIGGTLTILSKPHEGTEVNIEIRNKP
jgi:signal transduction histidine kinase